MMLVMFTLYALVNVYNNMHIDIFPHFITNNAMKYFVLGSIIMKLFLLFLNKMMVL